jgi:UDP-N-acetylglucosamine:LPS N-acetylglucosamine transferase
MHILILMNHAGGGHASVAQALSESLQSMGHTVESMNADLLSPANVTKLVTSTYGPIIQYTPSTFKQVFLATKTQRRVRLVNHTNALLIRQKLVRHIKRVSPDMIVSVQPLYVGSVAELRKYFPGVPFGVVVTDLVTIHPLWFDPRTDFTIVPTGEALDLGIQAGMSEAVLERIGLPIRSGFNIARRSKEDVRRELNLPMNRPVVIVGGSGEGAGNIQRIVQHLLEHDKCHVVAVAGRNNLLYQRLRQTTYGKQHVSLYKFIDFMPTLMMAADAIVTKPGPTIICEAMSMKLPMVILPTPLYQEQGNMDLVRTYNLGQVVDGVGDISDALEQLLGLPYAGRPFQSGDISQQTATSIVRHGRK